jgi:glutamate--cysteine ligase
VTPQTTALSRRDVVEHLQQRDTAPSAGPTRVGIEQEWHTACVTDPGRHLHPEEVLGAVAAAGPLPCGSSVTVEPGGQVELATVAVAPWWEALRALRTDGAVVRDAHARAGIVTLAAGTDPFRAPARTLSKPRYDAMEAYLDGGGGAGRRMMCGTASVQINLDMTGEGEPGDRWALAHALGPVLAAACANSPIVAGRPSRWRSARLAVWAAIDRTRTASAFTGDGTSPSEQWARYALDARVMLVRAGPERFVPVLEHLTFEEWMSKGHELGYPTDDDLAYHLTTLFPPVRLRGWMELRMVDALPDPWWRVPGAVATALLDDPEAAAEARAATAPTARLWHQAARPGLSHPALAASARRCFTAAIAALPRLGADPDTQAACAAFFDRFVARGRCPADDVLDRWAADRQVA